MDIIIETERLYLCRPDMDRDFDGFYGLMSDPASVRYIGNAVMNRAQTWRSICMLMGHW